MIKKVFNETFKEKWFMLIALVISSVFVIVMELAPAYILQRIIDTYLVENAIAINSDLLLLSILYFLCILISGLFNFLKQWILIILGENITCNIRKSMLSKIITIDPIYFNSNDAGTTVSRVINDVESINTMFTDGIVSMFVDVFKILAILIMLFKYNVYLGLFILLLTPIIYVVTRLIKMAMFKAQLNNRKSIGDVNNQISETIKNHRIVKIYSKEQYLHDQYEDKLQYNYLQKEKVNFFDSIYSPFIQVFTAIVCVVIIILTNSEISVFGLTIGMLAGAIQLVTSLFAPIDSLGMELQTIQKAMAGLKRVNEFFDEKNKKESLSIDTNDIVNSTNSLKVEDLCFSYNNNDIILSDINLKINTEMVSIVGRTGVGKTTLLKLIMGVLVPTEGKILLNNVNVLDIQDCQKCKIFGYVEQKMSLLNESLKDNLTMGNDVSDERINEVLEIVELTNVVANLPNGINTVIKKDYFSEGQLQLLSIARAIMLNPPILLLDEMSANLDSIAEQQILSIIKKICKSKTIISVSHRLSTIMMSNKIIKIEKGKIDKICTPKEMLSSDPWFKEKFKKDQLSWN